MSTVHFALTSACVNSWGDPIMMSRRLHSLARTRPTTGCNEVCGTIRLSDPVTVKNATCHVVAEWRRCRRSFIRGSCFRSAPVLLCTFFRLSTRRRFNAPISAMRRKARRFFSILGYQNSSKTNTLNTKLLSLIHISEPTRPY